MTRYTLFILIMLLSPSLKAQLNMIETEQMSLVTYDFGHKYILPHAARCFHNALNFHSKLFDYTPSEKITVLIQDFGDYGNGGATAVPKNAISMGLAPFSYAFETSPAGERVFSMMNHEMIHVLALDNSSKTDRFFRKAFFGKVKPTSDDPISMGYSYLTSPRRYSPRWYHEGIASYIETWMSGGVGLALGNYDEMVFRTRVLESAHIYSAQGLESEGTTTDFQGKSNSYLYGTRFMGYLAYTYSPEKIIAWVNRTENSKRSYSKQYKNVFGKPLEKGWADWITFEKEFQKQNIETLSINPITEMEPITKKVLGSVSQAYYNDKTNDIYVAINYPGQVPHLAAINLANGHIKKLTDIKGAALFYVSSITYDQDNETIFFTTDNDRWRDLNSYNLKSKKTKLLQRDVRTGDLAFNKSDKSIWGIKHLNGLSTIVRIPKSANSGDSINREYSTWQQKATLPYGKDIFDIDISPDGLKMSAAVSDYNGRQILLMFDVAKLDEGIVEPDTVFNFDVSSPQSFKFSTDGKYLMGSAYYTGVSNIFRFNANTYDLEVLSNTLTGIFRPIEIDEEHLFAFKFSSDGFQPVLIDNKAVDNVKRIEFLGNITVDKHPQLYDWEVPVPTAEDIDIEAMTINEGTYIPKKQLKLNYAYPIITGYKDFIGIGYKLNLSDPLSFQEWDIAFAYTPTTWTNPITSDSIGLELQNDETFHFSLRGKSGKYSWHASYNGADFYDLFGPTKVSRKGIIAGFNYDQSLIWNPPQKLDLGLGLSGFYGLEGSPFFQNLESDGFENNFYLTLNASLTYSNRKISLGAVDYEKGMLTSVRTLGALSAGNLYPTIIGTFDYGFQLPINHFSIWLRSAAGNAFSNSANPFTRFGFAAFGNNYIDHGSFRKFRGPFSFPGLRYDADVTIVSKEFFKGMAEFVLPPIRFKKLGTLNLYSNWIQPTVFSSVLTYGNPTGGIASFVNFGTQIDMRIVLFSLWSSTFSVGYAQAYDLNDTSSQFDEWMISLKIL